MKVNSILLYFVGRKVLVLWPEPGCLSLADERDFHLHGIAVPLGIGVSSSWIISVACAFARRAPCARLEFKTTPKSFVYDCTISIVQFVFALILFLLQNFLFPPGFNASGLTPGKCLHYELCGDSVSVVLCIFVLTSAVLPLF